VFEKRAVGMYGGVGMPTTGESPSDSGGDPYKLIPDPLGIRLATGEIPAKGIRNEPAAQSGANLGRR
jgi:hypothetical protein